jgi:hypothetical protein
MTRFREREMLAGEEGEGVARLVNTSPFASDFWACPQLDGRAREMRSENGEASCKQWENAQVPKWNQSEGPLFILTLAATGPSLFAQARSARSLRGHFAVGRESKNPSCRPKCCGVERRLSSKSHHTRVEGVGRTKGVCRDLVCIRLQLTRVTRDCSRRL